jgi:hypothetical protein
MKFVAILIVTTVLAVSCGGVISLETPTSVSSTSATTVAQMTSFEKMEIAFEGGYNKAEIKPRLERAMDLYGVPITEEIYSRAGSTLVALRKNTAVKEMDILG